MNNVIADANLKALLEIRENINPKDYLKQNEKKGEKKCARSACNNEHQKMFNKSTLMFYCEECAIRINRAAKGPLCTVVA